MFRNGSGPLVAVLLASCASLPPDRGNDEFNALLDDRRTVRLATTSAEREAALADARDRLGRPLRLDDAVAIALARSPEAAAALARLDLAYADLLEGSRVANPGIALSAQESDEDGARTKLGLSIVQSFSDVVLLRSRRAIAAGEFASAQEDAVRAVQDLVAAVQEKYFALLGARQVAEMREVIARAARASAELARRYHGAGNIPELELRRSEAEAVEAELEASRARSESTRAYHALGAALGLRPGEAAWRVDARLPLPVAAEDEPEALTALAFRSRTDLAARRRETETLARSLGVTRRFRWLGGFDLGVEAERETDGAKLVGPSVAFELPIFHRNEAALARAQARVAQAEAQALALEGEIGHGVLAARAAVVAARERAERHRDELVPLRENIVARMQERYDFMLDGAFELIAAKREEYAAYEGYLLALRDYWTARAELAHVVGAALPSNASMGGSARVGPVRLSAAPAGASHQHGGVAPGIGAEAPPTGASRPGVAAEAAPAGGDEAHGTHETRETHETHESQDAHETHDAHDVRETQDEQEEHRR